MTTVALAWSLRSNAGSPLNSTVKKNVADMRELLLPPLGQARHLGSTSKATGYGWCEIIGVSVGNEVLFDDYQPLHVLLGHIKEFRDRVTQLGHPEIPVFTSDLVAAVRPSLTDNEDKADVNLHPFFARVPVSEVRSYLDHRSGLAHLPSHTSNVGSIPLL
ncbi:hypothetical protein BGX34_009174 [Mortierella sp. NVP85]|nr:hypothetical protein BGX34_009174 [Mortierella sp. NVP85]